MTRTVLSFIHHVFGLHILIITYSESCVANEHLDFIHSAVLLFALLFIPNLFSHNSVQRFTYPRDLFLPDSIYMSTSCLDFQQFFHNCFQETVFRNKVETCHPIQLGSCDRILKEKYEVTTQFSNIKLRLITCFIPGHCVLSVLVQDLAV